jgi:hypothetical protein
MGTIDAMLMEVEANLSRLLIDPDRAVANAGNARLLRGVLAEHCFSTGSPKRLNVAVLGGSMTQGSQNCLSRAGVLCKGRFLMRRELTWHGRLSSLLQRALPGCRVTMRPRLKPANRIDSLLPAMSPLDPSDHIVVEDFTVNDQRGNTVVEGVLNDTRVLSLTIAGHEVVAQAARAQNSSLLLMESFPAFGRPPRCATYDDYVHRAVAQAYALPLISFMRAVCTEAERRAYSGEPAQRHWRAGCGTIDAEGMGCEPHPGPYTHGIYALLLARYVLRHAALACADMGVSAHGVKEQPLPSPSAHVLPAEQMEKLRGCGPTDIRTRIDMAEECGEPFHRNGSWRCYEDMPGKPGWIAEQQQSAGLGSSTSVGSGQPLPPQALTFVMRANSRGKLIVGYLRSYEGMARASLFVNGHSDHFVTLDGLWESNTSQTQFAMFQWSAIANHTILGSSHHPSRVQVTLTVPAVGTRPYDVPGRASKFKLVELRSCGN